MTAAELYERQSWNLSQKIDHTVGTLEAFFNATEGKAYVSFSGGKDSTVLLDICRRYVNPQAKAVFCNTGNEYPEIVQFVRQTDNVVILRPDLNISGVISKYGFPLVSKEQAYFIWQARNTKSEKLRHRLIHGKKGYTGRTLGKIYNKWQYLIEAPFEISHKCCECLKKQPFAKYEKETGERPIIGTMATEGRLRIQNYLRRENCNVLTPGKENSRPIAFWTEDDIWEYIRRYGISYAAIYDKGAKRTGCMVCGFGADQNPDRFFPLFEQYQKAYKIFMELQNNGVTYREALHHIGITLPDDLL